MKSDRLRALRRACLLGFLILLVGTGTLHAQTRSMSDTTIIFTPSKPDVIRSEKSAALRNSWGIDIMVSGNGFGLGGYYRTEFTDQLAGSISLLISDVKAEGEVEYVDAWTGQTFVPGKVNRLLMLPLTVSVQYRLFRDDIMDNFRPFVMAGAGPSMIFVAPYSRTVPSSIPGFDFQEEQIDFFTSLKYGKAHYTAGMFVGAGAYFGTGGENLMGLSARYYYVPFTKGIEVMRDGVVRTFGGFYITISFGSLY